MVNDIAASDKRPRGGPSTIWGVLYQMLWCLLRSLELRAVNTVLDDKGLPTQVELLLEPSKGGDAQEIGAGRRRIVQLKTRSGGKTWSLRDVIVEVLPDLYLAADPNTSTAYDFVTDAEMGNWRAVYTFMSHLNDRPYELNSLDTTTPLKFSGPQHRPEPGDNTTPFWTSTTYTERALFDFIVDAIRVAKKDAADEPIETARRKTWALLGGFNFIGGRSFRAMERDVDALLLAVVDHPEHVTEKRNALLTELQKIAAGGDASVRTAELLADYGLNSTPLTDWITLRARGRELLRHHTCVLQGYRPDHDVRTSAAEALWADWRDGPPLLGLAGESGEGKSWHFFALADCATADNSLVVLVEAKDDAAADLQAAADLFWHRIKHNTTTMPLSGMHRLRRDLLPAFDGPWLTLLIDNVQSRREAIALATADVESDGIRLAINGPPSVVRAFEVAARGRARVASVGLFRPTERDTYLQRRLGDAWIDVPGDVRDTLLQPLLAGIYCDEVADPAGWTPTSEYALYDRAWTRLDSGPDPAGAYGKRALRILAGSVLEGHLYPWTIDDLLRAGVDEQMQARLIACNWLRTTALTRYEVPHDRLLNYAVAQHLFERCLGVDGPDGVVAVLRTLLLESPLYSGRALGYVTLDVMHLLLDAGAQGISACETLLAALSDLPHIEYEILFGELLPTLGSRAVPVLVARLRAVHDPEQILLQNALVEGLLRLDPAAVRPLAVALLDDEHPGPRRAAVRLLAAVPDASVLDRLWRLHVEETSQPPADQPERITQHWQYGQNMRALHACVALDPPWLARTLRATPAGTIAVADLGYLLADLPDGAAVWQAHKNDLFAKLPADKQRAAATNIGRYRDAAEIPRLLDLVTQTDDFADAAAVQALLRIDTNLALQEMTRLDQNTRALSRGRFMPALLEFRREETTAVWLEQMRATDDPWTHVGVYDGYQNDMSGPMLDLLLDKLNDRLVETLASDATNQVNLFRPLHFLRNIWRPELVERLQARQGTDLDRNLADYLLRLGPRPGVGTDSLEREPALSLLARIGGPAYVRVVNAFLSTGTMYGVLDAVEAARRGNDADTVGRLLSVVRRPDDPGIEGHVRQLATRLLAETGQTRALVDAVMLLGPNSIFVANFVQAARPFDDDAIEPALTALTSAGEQPVAGAVMALGIAGVSKYAADVLDLLDTAEPGSDLALAGVMAVGLLRDTSERACKALERHFGTPVVGTWARRALLTIGTDAADAILLAELRRQFDPEIAINLARRFALRNDVLDLVIAHLAGLQEFFIDDALQWLIPALDATELAFVTAALPVADVVRSTALAAEGRSRIVGRRLRAVRTLAAADPAAGFAIAEHVLADANAHDRAAYPALLLKLDESRAVGTLLRLAVAERSPMVLHAIGRAMAGVDISNELAELLQDARPEHRSTACTLCRYRRPDATIHALVVAVAQDEHRTVAREALRTLKQWRDDAAVAVWATAFEAEPSLERRWVMLDAMLAPSDAGDAASLPTWLKDLSRSLTPAMAMFVQDRLLQLRQKRDEDLEKEVQRSRRV